MAHIIQASILKQQRKQQKLTATAKQTKIFQLCEVIKEAPPGASTVFSSSLFSAT